jgi:hypothetical protein
MDHNNLHSVDQKEPRSSSSSSGSGFSWAPVLIIIVVAIASGFGASRLFAKNTTSTSNSIMQGTAKESLGTKNTKLFPDMAEGTVKKGGVEGEGTHHLVRKGGESQNVYMTSSVVDLDALVGKKVTVWGKTYDAQKAGWLMDVGYVEVR